MVLRRSVRRVARLRAEEGLCELFLGCVEATHWQGLGRGRAARRGAAGKDLLETEGKSPVVKEKGAELEMRLGVSCGAFRPHWGVWSYFQGAERMCWRILRQESDVVRHAGIFGGRLSLEHGGVAGRAGEGGGGRLWCERRERRWWFPPEGVLRGWPHLDLSHYKREGEESRMPPGLLTHPPKWVPWAEIEGPRRTGMWTDDGSVGACGT